MNKTIYNDSQKNALRISALNEYKAEVPFSGFSAKFVVSGKESYQIKGKQYVVESGEYLLGNANTIATIEINGKTVTQGICIDVSEQIIAEVASYHFMQADAINAFIIGEQFLVNKYKSHNTHLGYALNEINLQLSSGTMHNYLLDDELFYSIAESIIADQRLIYEQFSKLQYKKQATKEALFRQLLEAKDLIDEQYLTDLNIDRIALDACISKYHFIRLFNSTFNLSPYQYIISKRLMHAKILILEGQSIPEVAIKMGYADLAAFSKAFKACFGFPPSAVRLK